MRRYKKFFEEELLNFWQVCEKLNITKQAEDIHDIWIKWHNRNSVNAILQIIKNKKFQLVCKLRYYQEQILKESNFGKNIINLEEFEKSLNKIIKIYRGGSGEYNKEYLYKNSFVSFTADRKRADTFSIYKGTYASKAFVLDKNDHYWIVELVLPLKDILAYYDVGDEEVIVSVEDAKNARVIKKQ